jgi:hypothetical protein
MQIPSRKITYQSQVASHHSKCNNLSLRNSLEVYSQTHAWYKPSNRLLNITNKARSPIMITRRMA